MKYTPQLVSFPTTSPDILAESDQIGNVVRDILEKNILPRDSMTQTDFELGPVCILSEIDQYSPNVQLDRFSKV
jgi:hypothetical protein